MHSLQMMFSFYPLFHSTNEWECMNEWKWKLYYRVKVDLAEGEKLSTIKINRIS